MASAVLAAIRRPTPFDISRLLFVGAIWGASFIFVSLSLVDFQPISIAAWRVFLGALILLALALLSRSRFPRELRHWRYIFVVGSLNSAIPFFLISWGQQTISSAESALLMAMGTFCALLLSHFTSNDERITPARALGVSLGFIGVLVLVLWELLETGLDGIMGQLAVLTAGCSYAVSTVISRRITHLPPIATSAGTLLCASLYMVPLAFLLEDPLPSAPGNTALASLIYLGVVATALAVTIRFTIVRANGAVFMGQVGYLVPLFGVVFSGIYFANAINLQTLLSLGLILTGIAITRLSR